MHTRSSVEEIQARLTALLKCYTTADPIWWGATVEFWLRGHEYVHEDVRNFLAHAPSDMEYLLGRIPPTEDDALTYLRAAHSEEEPRSSGDATTLETAQTMIKGLQGRVRGLERELDETRQHERE